VEARLKAHGVPTAVHSPVPLHLQPVFGDLQQGPGSFPASEAAAARVISLPMHPYLTEEQQVKVVAALKAAVSG
jgi:UDP-2-acetamido-2-deoxy-ribo-hexuluronate aminotransferase